MTNRYSRVLLLFYIIDVFIILFSFHISSILRFGWINSFSLPPVYGLFLLFLTLIWSGLTLFFRTYREEHLRPYRKHLFQYANCQFCFLLSLFGFITVFELHVISRLFIGYFTTLEITLTLIFHLLRHKFVLEYRKTGRNYRRVMLIGNNNELIDHISNWILKNPGTGLKLEGVLSNIDLEKEPPKTVKTIFNQKEIDYLIVVSSRRIEKLMPKIVSIADNTGIRVKIVSPDLRAVVGRVNFDTLAGIPIVNLRSEPLESLRNRILKRILDITVSSIAIVIIHSWLIPLIGAIIRITSRGPAIFCQKRIGKDGKEFLIYKFRTMTTDHHKSAEEALAGIGEITKKGDDRLTAIGRWLRKTNIDEFPQFFNVLSGNMSLVGPRPHMLSEDNDLEERLEKYPVRRYVKPGITGWAQTNGYRGGTRDMTLMQKRTEYDIWYVENWSLWLDIKIIAVTLWQMVTDRAGAH